MTSLRGSIVVLIVVFGVTNSQDFGYPASLFSVGDTDPEYRPWHRNDTAATWISLGGMRIGELSPMFRLNIPNLRWLVMDDNHIKIIPSRAFRSFPNLTYISLVKNQIIRFEVGAFDGLENLEVLDLDGNPIRRHVDFSILEPLIRLKRLYLRRCEIIFFDLPPNMDHLSHLFLSENELNRFYIGNESSLSYLHLNDNRLTYVSLAEFKTLIYVNLHNNKLKKIVRRSAVPRTYYATLSRDRGYYGSSASPDMDEPGLYLDDAAAVLQHLILSFNQITEINSDAFLDAKALSHLDLRFNKIGTVHAETFNNLPKLEHILLDSNEIKQINHRVFINLPNLKNISLKYNQIDDLDEDAFTKLNSTTNEVYLFLDNNRIHTLRKGSFRGIQGLKHIGLSNNRIKSISSQTFVDLPNLGSIVIENQWTDESVDRYQWNDMGIQMPVTRQGLIESDAFFNLSNLVSITIRGNSFTGLEARAFHDLPKLTTLDLSDNKISKLSAEAFCDLPAMENLYLGHNSISEIAPGTFPKQLKHLNVASNLACPKFSCWHVGELRQLQYLDVSGTIKRFPIDDLTGLNKNLTVIVSNEESTSGLPASSY